MSPYRFLSICLICEMLKWHKKVCNKSVQQKSSFSLVNFVGCTPYPLMKLLTRNFKVYKLLRETFAQMPYHTSEKPIGTTNYSYLH